MWCVFCGCFSSVLWEFFSDLWDDLVGKCDADLDRHGKISFGADVIALFEEAVVETLMELAMVSCFLSAHVTGRIGRG